MLVKKNDLSYEPECNAVVVLEGLEPREMLSSFAEKLGGWEEESFQSGKFSRYLCSSGGMCEIAVAVAQN